MQPLQPCLWFDNQAEDAAKFYTKVFETGKIGTIARYGKSGAEVSGQKEGSVMTVDFEIDGYKVTALNGGPMFKFSPAISFMVWRKTEKEVDALWKQLTEGGQVRMAMDTYPWSKKYGWVADKFGVDWQIMLNDDIHDIAPSILFVDKKFGKAERAIEHYVSTFKNCHVDNLMRNTDGPGVMFSQLSIEGQPLVVMDGAGTHNFDFTHAYSIMVNCKDQAEMDQYYDRLSEGGSQEPCGWVMDKFGVSWQIVPMQMEEYMKDPRKAEAVMAELMKMKRIDLKKLQETYERA